MSSKLPLFLSTLAAAAAAAVVVLATPSPGWAGPVEDRLNALHARCDHGDQHACVEFGRVLEANRARHDEWRNVHPEYWAPRPPVIAVVPPRPAVVEVWGSPEHLIRLHHDCERGIHAACREYRDVLESQRAYHAEWRRTHPEFWVWLR